MGENSEPIAERVLRPLAKLEPEEQREAWVIATDGDSQVNTLKISVYNMVRFLGSPSQSLLRLPRTHRLEPPNPAFGAH